MTGLSRSDVLARAAKVRLVIFDVDGVLTDGRLYFTPDGQEFKSFHVRDGLGLKQLRRTGVETAVISGRYSPAVNLRMEGLGITHVYQGQENKLEAFEALLRLLQLSPHETAYIGDDLPDLPVFRQVGLAVAVADAHAAVREQAHWITTQPGGAGAAREVCDLIMAAQGTLHSERDA